VTVYRAVVIPELPQPKLASYTDSLVSFMMHPVVSLNPPL
jgi:hypothetical protein